MDIYTTIELVFRKEIYVSVGGYSSVPDYLADLLADLMPGIDLITSIDLMPGIDLMTGIDQYADISATPIDIMVAQSCGLIYDKLRVELMIRIGDVYTTLYIYTITVNSVQFAVVTHADNPLTPVIVPPFTTETIGSLAEMVVACIRSLA